MYNVRCGALAACALFAFGAYAVQPASDAVQPVGDENSVCQSFGVDFQDEGSYFINTNSNESFSSVSYFEGNSRVSCQIGEGFSPVCAGCNPDNAYVMLVDVNGDRQFDCSTLPTTPDDVDQTSTWYGIPCGS